MKILFLLLPFLLCAGEVKDFGVFGKTYPILENDFEEEIKKEAQKLILDKKELEPKFIEEVKRAAKVSSELPLCMNTQKGSPIIDYITVPENVFNPVGRLIYTKGQKVESKLPAGKELNLCFVDGRNEIALKNQISAFSEKYHDCIFLVSNENILYLREKFPKQQIFPTSKPQEDRFGVKCYPAIIHMEKNTKENLYYSYEEFKN